jgi:hypothetical protein
MPSEPRRRRSTAQPIPTVAPKSVSATAIKAQPAGQPLQKPAALVYGKFINAAYNMFESPIGDSMHPLPPKGVFPDGYTLTAWIHMTDFVLTIKEKEFYGFIATQDDDPRSHVIVVRGTQTPLEWIDNLTFLPVPFVPVREAGLVHLGFYAIYRSMHVVRARQPIAPVERAAPHVEPQAQLDAAPEGATFADQVEYVFAQHAEAHPPRIGDGESDHVIVAAHSLGSALTTMYVMEHAIKKLKRHQHRRVTIERLCTFASPRVGLIRFAKTFDTLPIDSWRIVNRLDLVPMVPPPVPIFFRHVATRYPFCSSGWARWNPICSHSMLTYMHWLDPTVPLLSQCIRGAVPTTATPASSTPGTGAAAEG